MIFHAPYESQNKFISMNKGNPDYPSNLKLDLCILSPLSCPGPVLCAHMVDERRDFLKFSVYS